MSYFTKEEQKIIDQAITILNTKLKTELVACNNVLSIKNFLRLQMEQCQREHLGVLYLDTQLRLIEYRIVFSGAVNYCTMSPREIVKDALQLNATSIIIAHNHPSGNSEPSRADIFSTLKTKEALGSVHLSFVGCKFG